MDPANLSPGVSLLPGRPEHQSNPSQTYLSPYRCNKSNGAAKYTKTISTSTRTVYVTTRTILKKRTHPLKCKEYKGDEALYNKQLNLIASFVRWDENAKISNFAHVTKASVVGRKLLNYTSMIDISVYLIDTYR